MTFQDKLKYCLAFFLCLSALIAAQESLTRPVSISAPYRFSFSTVEGRMALEKAAMFEHFGFDKWKGTCVEPCKTIQRLPISADMFPPLWKKSIVFIEWNISNYYFHVRMEDKKDRLKFVEIKLFLNSAPLRAQEFMLRHWAALKSNCSMYMEPGARLDMDIAFDYKIVDDSFSSNDIKNVIKRRKYSKTIDDGYRYMIFDDPFKYMIGDHCIYSKGNYLSFTRNNVMVSIHFRNNDEKMFQLAQRIDARLHLASVQSDAESIDIKSVPGFVVDESGFSPKPPVGRKRKFTLWRRIKQSTGDFWDGLSHAMKKLFR